jgi:hypothetical protein
MKFLDLSRIIEGGEEESIIINAQNILYIEPIHWETYFEGDWNEGYTSQITMINGEKLHVSNDPDIFLKLNIS